MPVRARRGQAAASAARQGHPVRERQRPAPPVLRYQNFRMISPRANKTWEYPDAMVVFLSKPFSFKADSTDTELR